MKFVPWILLLLLSFSPLAAASCSRCATEIGEGHNYCFHCGLPLRDELRVFADEAEKTVAVLRAPEGRSILQGPEAKILSHDRRAGWLWIDKGKANGLEWGGYYTAYHDGQWKALLRIRKLEATKSRCKLILGKLSDLQVGYRLASFRNIPYEVLQGKLDEHVGAPLVWYGRLVDLTRRGDSTYLHVACTWQDDYRELRETFGREKGLFRSFKVSENARHLLENSLVKGSFLAQFTGTLPPIDKDSKVLVVGTPVQRIAHGSPDGSQIPIPLLRVFHLKYWKGTPR